MAGDVDLEEVSVLLRSLADSTRLRMIAALIDAPRTLSELTSLLSIDIESAAHQLRKLESAGLLVATTDSKVRFIADLSRLQRVAIQLSPPKRVRGAATAAEVDSETRGVLSAFFNGPRLNALPVQRRKKELVLEELLRRIPAQEEYREAELNQMIGAIFDDFCSVRREWVMAGYMARDRGVYRLAARGRAVLSA
nr:DUF2087 domain-containing protein [Myxococcus sp. AM009]